MKTIPRAFWSGLLLVLAGSFAVRQVTAQPGATSNPDAGLTAPLVIAAPQSQPAAAPALIYAESVPNAEESTLWRADAANPAQRTALATVSHKSGYPPVGTISPDGSKIALLVIPPQADERAARTSGGEVWTLNSDGSGLTRAAFRAGGLEQWSPDGAWFVTSRLTPLAAPSDPQAPFRTEFYRVRADGSSGNLLLSDDSSYGVIGLGWSAEGAYLAARGDTRGYWQISAQDAASGATLQSWPLAGISHLRAISLAPDGRRVLIENLVDGTDSLAVLDLQAGSVQAQASLASAPMPDELPVGPFEAVWRGGDVWVYHQPRGGQSARAGLAGAENEAALPEAISGAGEYLLPESWSPGGGWLLWKLYPYNSTNLYVQAADSSALAQIEPQQEGNWLTFFGWVMSDGSAQ